MNPPTPDPNIAWQVILTIGVLVAIGANIFTAARAQKREVSFSFEPASKEEFKRHMAANAQEHRDLFAKIGGVDRGSGQKISSEIQAMHVRVNAIEKSVGGLETSTELQNQQLTQMQADIKRILETMPRRSA